MIFNAIIGIRVTAGYKCNKAGDVMLRYKESFLGCEGARRAEFTYIFLGSGFFLS